jgi:hypothetical protein
LSQRLPFIVLGVAILISMSTSKAQAAPSFTVESPLAWLRVTPANDPQVAKEAIGQAAFAALADVLPYSVVVKNQGTVTLVGIGVRFQITKGSKTLTRDFFYHSFAQPTDPAFAPGQSRLITPLRGANAVAYGQTPPSSGGERSASESQTLTDLSTAEHIHAIVDLVITQDGRTAGGDAAHAIQKMTSQAQASYDTTREVLARLNRDSDAQVTEWLSTVSQQRVSRQPIAQATDQYTSVQRILTAGWLRQMSSGKREELKSQLVLITNAEDPTFVFLKSLHGGLQ